MRVPVIAHILVRLTCAHLSVRAVLQPPKSPPKGHSAPDTACHQPILPSQGPRRGQLRTYKKQSGESLEMQNDCAEIKIRAERRGGKLLRDMSKHPPGPKSKDRFHDETELPPKLKDIGIDKNESHRWQKVASVPEDLFEWHVTQTKAAGQELTTASVTLGGSLRRRVVRCACQDRRRH